jgi:1,4-dihydroxy-2-naphthoate octaprenyltransferase
MLRSLALAPSLPGTILIAAIVFCKYSNSPIIFLLIVLLTSIYYQRDTYNKNNKADNFEESLINMSKFIIVTGILGYVVVRIMGLFLPGFD